MPKLKLVWVTCPVCQGYGGWVDNIDYDHDDNPITDWHVCDLCRGKGKTQKPTQVKEKHA